MWKKAMLLGMSAAASMTLAVVTGVVAGAGITFAVSERRRRQDIKNMGIELTELTGHIVELRREVASFDKALGGPAT